LAKFTAIRVTGVTAFGCDLSIVLGDLWGRLIMPTDLGDKEQAQAQASFNAMVLICFITCLVFLTLLLVDEGFSWASVKLMSPFVELRP
jgi:hypothetical protein